MTSLHGCRILRILFRDNFRSYPVPGVNESDVEATGWEASGSWGSNIYLYNDNDLIRALFVNGTGVLGRRIETRDEYLIIRAQIKLLETPGGILPTLSVYNGDGTDLCYKMLISSNGEIVIKESDEDIIGTSSAVLVVGVVHTLEIRSTISNAGSVLVKVDGAIVLDVTGDTTQGENKADYIVIGTDENMLWGDIAAYDGQPSEMYDWLLSLLPKGAAWQPKPGGDFEALLDGIGNCAQEMYWLIDAVAHTRDPYKTTNLSVLEHEYGITPELEADTTTRRLWAALTKYAKATTNSCDQVQARLREAGYSLVNVTPNDPTTDPNPLDGTLVVNGPLYESQDPQYLAQCNGDNTFCGNAKAICGYFTDTGLTELEYTIPDVYKCWRFVFWITGPIEYADDPGVERAIRLILKYKPLRTWGILRFDVLLDFADLDFTRACESYMLTLQDPGVE